MLRIQQYFLCSDECFWISMVYFDRLLALHPDLVLSYLNVYKMLLVSMVIAAKFHDDLYYSNEYYARVGGLQLSQLNMLEVEFLKLLSWAMHVTQLDYRSVQHYALTCDDQFRHVHSCRQQWLKPESTEPIKMQLVEPNSRNSVSGQTSLRMRSSNKTGVVRKDPRSRPRSRQCVVSQLLSSSGSATTLAVKLEGGIPTKHLRQTEQKIKKNRLVRGNLSSRSFRECIDALVSVTARLTLQAASSDACMLIPIPL